MKIVQAIEELVTAIVHVLQALGVENQRIADMGKALFRAFWDRRLLHQFNGLISGAIAAKIDKAIETDILEKCQS